MFEPSIHVPGNPGAGVADDDDADAVAGAAREGAPQTENAARPAVTEGRYRVVVASRGSARTVRRCG
jgi:hypothetical protein